MEKYCYGPRHEGVWYDGCRGRYILFRIVDLAVRHGWNKTGMWDENSDEFYDAVKEAEAHMQQFAQMGYSFGTHPDTNDWGLWKDENKDD